MSAEGIDAAALAILRRDWIAHEQGELAFANTITNATCSTPVARDLRRALVLNSGALAALDELARVHFGFVATKRLPAPSEAARDMIAARTDHPPRRIGPLTTAQLAALCAYALERIILLQNIMALRVSAGLLDDTLTGELRYWQALRATLKETVPA